MCLSFFQVPKNTDEVWRALAVSRSLQYSLQYLSSPLLVPGARCSPRVQEAGEVIDQRGAVNLLKPCLWPAVEQLVRWPVSTVTYWSRGNSHELHELIYMIDCAVMILE